MTCDNVIALVACAAVMFFDRIVAILMCRKEAATKQREKRMFLLKIKITRR